MYRRTHLFLCAALVLGGLASARPATALPEAAQANRALPEAAQANTALPGGALDPGQALSQYVHDTWRVPDGLPQNRVEAVAQTPEGYLWVATDEGLGRFDGVTFTVFDKRNTPALRDNHLIRTLEVDQSGRLWIGTNGGGLVRYAGETFVRYGAAEGLTGTQVSALHEDAAGVLWVGTLDAGLFYLKDGRFVAHEAGLSGRKVTALHRDRAGTLWVGTDRGLDRVQGARAAAPRLFADDFVLDLHEDAAGVLWIGTRRGVERLKGGVPVRGGLAGVPRGVGVFSIYEDTAGSIWLGTDGRGVLRIRPDGPGGRTEAFAQGGLLQDRVMALFQDREGSLWFGTEAGGLHRLRSGKFTVYGTLEGLGSDMVLSAYEDASGSLWIGTDGGGIGRLRPDGAGGRITTYPTGTASDAVYSIHGDREGNVWAGTYGGGLVRFAAGAAGAGAPRITTYDTRNGFPSDAVFALHLGPSGSLWVGTDAGLARYRDGRFTTYTRRDGLSSDFITALHEDRTGTLWVGLLDAGLNRIRDGRVEPYPALARRTVTAIHEDADGVLWFGTYGGGLTRLKDGALVTFTTAEGLYSDNIYQILEDAQGRLWMGCNKGIFYVDRRALDDVAAGRRALLAPVAFGETDGLRSAEVVGGNQPAGWRGRDGRLWFPTTRGLAVIDPAHLRRNEQPPPVIVASVWADQHRLAPDARPTLRPGTKKVEFHYTAPSFIASDQIVFKYRLDGYDTDWVDGGTSRAAVYTNLDPGTYTFRVLARNADGVWSEAEAAFAFDLRPFLYQQPWFWFVCALGVAALGLFAYRLRLRQLGARQRALEALVAERTADLRAAHDRLAAQSEQLQELDRFKSRFFANVSHEFRTPLTLMIGPLEQVLQGRYGRVDDAVQGPLGVALRNAFRLLRLINQLLDLARLESGKMPLRARPHDLSRFLAGVVATFDALAREKGLALSFHAGHPDLSLYVDADKLEKVFFNLLSNAAKFTPEGGAIRVTATLAAPDAGAPEGRVVVRVRDTGIGIPATELPYVFDRFHQVDDPFTRRYQGSGIGLAFVRELVLLHGGTVDVASEAGQWTEFTVTLPKGTAHLSPQDLADHDLADQDLADHDLAGEAGPGAMLDAMLDAVPGDEAWPPAVPGAPAAGDDATAPFAGPADAPLILVVDDQPELRAYVAGCLNDRYRVALARDGAEGLERVAALQPDLIIADVTMPVLDGYGLCRAVKADAALRHLPVILLSARASQESIVQGLEDGADDYVAKPFNARELRARVANLLQLRAQERALQALNESLERKVDEQLQVILDGRRAYEARLLVEKEKAEEAARLKTAILNNMSHEFRTPLTSILGYAELLAGEVAGPLQEFPAYILKSGQRLLDTLSAILEVARLEAAKPTLQPEPVALVPALERVVAAFRPRAAEKGLALHVSASEPGLLLQADAGALARVVGVLVDNAVKFTRAGTVDVAAGRDERGVFVRVADTGVGIGRAFLPHLFEAFRQESSGDARVYEGSGLSLSIARQLVELMDGTIEVSSEKGRGSTFTLRFPEPVDAALVS